MAFKGGITMYSTDAIHRLLEAKNTECPLECLSKINLHYILEL